MLRRGIILAARRSIPNNSINCILSRIDQNVAGILNLMKIHNQDSTPKSPFNGPRSIPLYYALNNHLQPENKSVHSDLISKLNMISAINTGSSSTAKKFSNHNKAPTSNIFEKCANPIATFPNRFAPNQIIRIRQPIVMLLRPNIPPTAAIRPDICSFGSCCRDGYCGPRKRPECVKPRKPIRKPPKWGRSIPSRRHSPKRPRCGVPCDPCQPRKHKNRGLPCDPCHSRNHNSPCASPESTWRPEGYGNYGYRPC